MEYLQLLHKDFMELSDTFEAVSNEIIKNKVSRYPVFVATLKPVKLGVPFLSKGSAGNHFTYHVSFFEELKSKSLLYKEKEEEFKKIFKNPLDHACFLILYTSEPKFVSMSYIRKDTT